MAKERSPESNADASISTAPVTSPAPAAPPSTAKQATSAKIRVRKVRPTLLTFKDGTPYSSGEALIDQDEYDRWSKLGLVVKV